MKNRPTPRSVKKRPLLSTLVATSLFAGASAHAQTTLYWGGGNSSITDGTALPTTNTGLAGTWNDTHENWSSALSPTVYDPWVSGSIANLGYFTGASGSAAMTVSGNKTLNGMVASLTAATGSPSRFILTGSGSPTLTLGGSAARFLISATANGQGVAFSGVNLGASTTTLFKDGAGLLQIGSSASASDAFTGKVLIRSGQFTKESNTSLAGVTDFEVSGYRPSVTVATNGGFLFTAPTLRPLFSATAGTQNQISNNATINLGNRGTLLLEGGHATGTETIGSLRAQGTGFITNSAGTAGQTVNFGTLTRGTDGRATYIVTPTSSDLLVQNIRITDTTGLATNELLPWLSTSRGEWLMIDSGNSNQLTRVASTTANLNAANWGSTYNGTSNVRINGTMSGSLGGNQSLNSLSFQGTTGTSDLNLGNNTLTLNAGALGLSPQSDVNNIISNGTIRTSSSKPLYINTGASTAANLSMNATLAGNMDIYISGSTSVLFGVASPAAGTPNTYNGTVYVNSGTLRVTKDAGITGNVVVASGGGLVLERANGFASTSNITLGRDALLNTGATTPTLNGVVTMNGAQWLIADNAAPSLTKNGTGLVFNGGALTHNNATAGVLNLRTNVSYAASSETQAVFQRVNTGNFTINLNTGNNTTAQRTFDVADSTTLAAGTPEMLIDTVIANSGSGNSTGSLLKTGTGTLMLTGNNTYTGGTTVNGGTLQLGRITAAAQTNLTGTFSNSGVERDILTFAAPITGTMAVGQTVTGTNITAGRTIAGILNEYQVILNGTAGTSANQAATNIGLGAVDRIGSLAGNVTVNNTGTLLLSAGTSVAGAVNVAAGGSLEGSGTISGASSFANGSSIRVSNPATSPIGTITFNGTVTLGDANLAYDLDTPAASDRLAVASTGSLDIGTGTLDLTNFTFTAGAGYADGVYPLITTSSAITGTLGSPLTGTFGGKTVTLAINSTNIELTVSSGVADTTPPAITLNGSASVPVSWGGTYTELGATATDETAPLIPTVITTATPGGSVDTTKPGIYTVRYNTTDLAGNPAIEVTRTVTVTIANADLVGADGLTPLMKYAFGATSPTDTVQAPVLSSTATSLSLTAVVRTDDANVAVSGEAVDNLTSTWGTGGTVTMTVAADQTNRPANCQRRVFTVDTTAATRKFLRLKVVSTP